MKSKKGQVTTHQRKENILRRLSEALLRNHFVKAVIDFEKLELMNAYFLLESYERVKFFVKYSKITQEETPKTLLLYRDTILRFIKLSGEFHEEKDLSLEEEIFRLKMRKLAYEKYFIYFIFCKENLNQDEEEKDRYRDLKQDYHQILYFLGLTFYKLNNMEEAISHIECALTEALKIYRKNKLEEDLRKAKEYCVFLICLYEKLGKQEFVQAKTEMLISIIKEEDKLKGTISSQIPRCLPQKISFSGREILISSEDDIISLNIDFLKDKEKTRINTFEQKSSRFQKKTEENSEELSERSKKYSIFLEEYQIITSLLSQIHLEDDFSKREKYLIDFQNSYKKIENLKFTEEEECFVVFSKLIEKISKIEQEILDDQKKKKESEKVYQELMQEELKKEKQLRKKFRKLEELKKIQLSQKNSSSKNLPTNAAVESTSSLTTKKQNSNSKIDQTLEKLWKEANNYLSNNQFGRALGCYKKAISEAERRNRPVDCLRAFVLKGEFFSTRFQKTKDEQYKLEAIKAFNEAKKYEKLFENELIDDELSIWSSLLQDGLKKLNAHQEQKEEEEEELYSVYDVERPTSNPLDKGKEKVEGENEKSSISVENKLITPDNKEPILALQDKGKEKIEEKESKKVSIPVENVVVVPQNDKASFSPTVRVSFEHKYLRVQKEVLELGKVLHQAGHDVKIVGGYVRDLLLGKNPNDCDMVTSATPKQIAKILSRNGYFCKVAGTHSRQRHVLVFGIGRQRFKKPIEISTFRKKPLENSARNSKINQNERKTYNTNYGDNFVEDAFNRDCPLNSIYYDLFSHIVCTVFQESKDDFKNKIIRMIGDPIQRFTEDPLRILRLIDLKARYEDFTFHDSIPMAIEACKHHLKTLSPQRLLMQMNKFLFNGRGTNNFQLLKEYNLLEVLFPQTASLLESKNSALFRAVIALLIDMDKCKEQGFSLNAALFFSVLLWPVLYKNMIITPNANFTTIANKILDDQEKTIMLPRRLRYTIKQIWLIYLQENFKKALDHKILYPDYRRVEHLVSTFSLYMKEYSGKNEKAQQGNSGIVVNNIFQKSKGDSDLQGKQILNENQSTSTSGFHKG